MENKHKTIPVFVPHWGCPCDCLFCDQKKITGQQEEMTASRAAAIIASAIERKKPGEYWEIGFFGGSFTGIPASQQEALLSVAYAAVQSGQVDGIRLSTRPDYINDAVLDRLLRFGVTTVELGAQSMDEQVLTLNRRGHTAEKTQQAARLIRERGIGLGLQMMIGLPGDTAEKALQTAESFAKLQPDCVRIYPTLVIRGTGLHELYDHGAYTPLTVDEAVRQCSDLYGFFTEKGITVIRMGLLQMTAEDVVAGPYHPAFGELVMSACCYKQLQDMLRPLRGKSVVLRVHPRYVSVLTGQKKDNLRRAIKEFNLQHLNIEQDSTLAWGEVIPEAVDFR